MTNTSKQNISKDIPPIRDIELLTNAFEQFTQKTTALKNAYSSLKKQFLAVNLQLEKKNRELNSILTNISQGILFISLEGIITTYNASAETILDVSKDSALSRPFRENFPDDIFGFSIQKALSCGDVPPTFFSTLPSEKELEVTANVILSGDKHHNGIIVVIRDITKIRRLEAVANRNDRLKDLGEMAASMAHEIRNPLGGIEGFASLLCRDLHDNIPLHNMAKRIVTGSQALNRLVSNVLHYARPIQTNFAHTDLTHMITEVHSIFSADTLLSENINMIIDIPKTEVTAHLDREAIKSALLNLIINGAQAMPDGGKLKISLNTTSHNTIFTVNDTGTGIPEDMHEKIFSPFFTTKENGNGFGLSEVYKVIQAHNGTIEATSKPGDTTFTIKIPIKR